LEGHSGEKHTDKELYDEMERRGTLTSATEQVKGSSAQEPMDESKAKASKVKPMAGSKVGIEVRKGESLLGTKVTFFQNCKKKRLQSIKADVFSWTSAALVCAYERAWRARSTQKRFRNFPIILPSSQLSVQEGSPKRLAASRP
jgi:hypothetical protein